MGRTGTLIGAYLIWKYGFTATEAIAFMRIVRPGSVVGPQQQYMYLKQLEWTKWAAVDEMRKLQQTAIFAASKVVAPVTPPAETEDEMDVCIAIRTMVFKDGVAYLQAGGGIVFDSVEEDEYIETINKLKGNVRALEQAEREYSIGSFIRFLTEGLFSTEYWFDIQNVGAA